MVFTKKRFYILWSFKIESWYVRETPLSWDRCSTLSAQCPCLENVSSMSRTHHRFCIFTESSLLLSPFTKIKLHLQRTEWRDFPHSHPEIISWIVWTWYWSWLLKDKISWDKETVQRQRSIMTGKAFWKLDLWILKFYSPKKTGVKKEKRERQKNKNKNKS